jgi:hypothetical protein
MENTMMTWEDFKIFVPALETEYLGRLRSLTGTGIPLLQDKIKLLKEFTEALTAHEVEIERAAKPLAVELVREAIGRFIASMP